MTVAQRRSSLSVLVVASMFATGVAQAQVEGGDLRVRAADPEAAALIAMGAERSPTFRALVERIEASDLIVYVETRALPLAGRTQLLSATPACRHVRVSIRIPGLETDLIASIAHELVHVVEIAEAAQVIDQASLRQRFARVGTPGARPDTFCSPGALRTTAAVVRELRCRRGPVTHDTTHRWASPTPDQRTRISAPAGGR